MRLLLGDAVAQLKTLPTESIQTCVTSPPYFGLRDYGMPDQIGLEETPEDYTQKLVEVFREVRRVLKDDGTLWLNLGDSYASSQSNNGGYSAKSTLAGFTNPNTKGRQANNATKPRKIDHGLKPKDLIGIPWRVAFALQADGWYLRQDIIWHKPNPMPESVTDRCTKAHEYIFLLSKSSSYYFDHEAIRETAVTPIDTKAAQSFKALGGKARANYGTNEDKWKPDGKKNKRSVWTVTTKPYKGAHFATFPPDLIEPCILAGSKPGDFVLDPFLGSGTTGMVAQKFSRDFIGIELNPEYMKLAEARIHPSLFLAA
jgi:DNA modification methylase